MGLSWLTQTVQDGMLQREIDDVIYRRDKEINEDLIKHWNSSQPIKSSWSRDEVFVHGRESSSAIKFDDFFVRKNIDLQTRTNIPKNLTE